MKNIALKFLVISTVLIGIFTTNMHYASAEENIEISTTDTETGNEADIEAEEALLAPEVGNVDINNDERIIDIYLKNYSLGENEKLFALVWSEKNGQDDLVWYEMHPESDGAFHATVDPKGHMTAGMYFAHIYSKVNGINSFVGASDFEIHDTSCLGISFDQNETRKIYVNGVTSPSGIKKVRAGVWSKSDQSDLVWYPAYDEGSGQYSITVDVSKHKYNFGNYSIHFYAENNNNITNFISGTDINIKERHGVVTAQEMRAGRYWNFTNSGFDVLGKVKEYSFAVWSDKNGQNDLKWVKATWDSENGIMQAEYDKNNLKEFGSVSVHAYVELENGQKKFVGAGTFFNDGIYSNGIDVDTINNQGKYRISAKSFPKPDAISDMTCYIWNAEDQSDMYIYQMRKQSDGDYIADMDVKNHQYHTGVYSIHIYVKTKDGNVKFLDSANLEYKKENIKDSMKIETDNGTGDFVIKFSVRSIDSNIQQVRVAVWSKEDQSNCKWYTAEKDDNGYYVVKSNISEHGNIKEQYNIHIYGKDSSGKMNIIDAETMDFSMKGGEFVCTSDDRINFSVTLKNVHIPEKIKSIEFAVWSEENGQDDIRWYKTTKNEKNEYSVNIDTKLHNSRGRYALHAYAVLQNGNKVFVNACSDIYVSSLITTVTVENISKDSFEVLIELPFSENTYPKIRVPVWTDEKQSDIMWYTAKSEGNGLYSVKVYLDNHSNRSGNFNIHVYGITENNEYQLLCGETYYLDIQNSILISAPDGSYKRKITYYGNNESNVRFGVWSEENGQDDLVWYTAVSNGAGEYYSEILFDNHNENGEYYIHAYSDNGYLSGASFYMVDYVEWAINTANDDSVGYSQAHRSMNPDVDCSSFVFYALANNGYRSMLGTVPFYTGNMVSVIQKCGFKVYTYDDMSSLKPGDILWYRRNGFGHTEIYVGNGIMVGAHDSVVNGIDYPQGGDQTGEEVSTKAFSDPGWIYYLRK